MIYSVCAGTNMVNPRYYDGWEGLLRWPEQDARKWDKACSWGGSTDRALLIRHEFTRGRLVEEILHRVYRAHPEQDLLVIAVSGHGGQVPDTHGDEADGLDETICCYDGQLVDDYLAPVWRALRPGQRVVWIADTCHSGSNYRGGDGPFRPLSLRRLMADTDGQIIACTGCDDARVSYDGQTGGEFTEAMLATADSTPWERTWLDRVLTRRVGVDEDGYLGWVSRAATIMRRDQRPHYEEWGNVTEQFRNGRVLL